MPLKCPPTVFTLFTSIYDSDKPVSLLPILVSLNAYDVSGIICHFLSGVIWPWTSSKLQGASMYGWFYPLKELILMETWWQNMIWDFSNSEAILSFCILLKNKYSLSKSFVKIFVCDCKWVELYQSIFEVLHNAKKPYNK